MVRSPTTRHLLRAAAVLLLAVTASATAGCQSTTSDHAHAVAPAPAPTQTATPGRTTYFAQYGVSGHASRPRRLNPSVDGSLFMRGMHWTVWDARRAVGHGVAHVNDCRPSCADGHYTTHHVTVRLSQPRELCGSRYFTTMRVTGADYRTYGHWSGVGCR
jgi:hypothetical protein